MRKFLSTKKRKIVFIISVAVLVCAITAVLLWNANAAKPNVPEFLDKQGSDFTDNSYIAQRLDELFALLPYGDYPYYTVMGNESCGNSSCSSCNGKNVSRMHPTLKDLGIVDTYDSWSCFAFARYASQFIYGVQASGLSYYGNTGGNLRRVGRVAAKTSDLSSISGEYSDYTLASLKDLVSKATVGDILQVRGKWGNHTMLFLGCDDDGIYIIHNNSFTSTKDRNGRVYGHNRVLISFLSYEYIIGGWNSIFTVYRAEEKAYNETWAKGASMCDEHTFTDEGGDYCVKCHKRSDNIKVTTDCIGLYSPVSATTAMKKSPYNSSSKVSNAPSVVTVIAKYVNSVGATWYKTSDGYYIPEQSLNPFTPSPDISMAMTGYPIGEKPLGKSFTLSGMIRSFGKPLKSVSGYLISSNGFISQSITVSISANSFSIEPTDVNYKLQFNRLIIGNYTYLVVASTEDGKYQFFKSNFSISSNPTEITKKDVAAPPMPSKIEIADVYVVLEYLPGGEYSMDGKTWQSNTLFSGLTPGTNYKFYQRYAETAETNASPASEPLNIKTDTMRKPPEAPKLASSTSFGDTWVTLKSEGTNYEYSCDAEHWQKSPEFTGLSPATEYMFFKRDSNAKVSSAGFLFKTTKSKVTPPSSPQIVALTETSITVSYNSNFEYGIRQARSGKEIEWQDPATFKGTFKELLYATDYYIYCRIAETEKTFQTSPSDPAICRTDKAEETRVPSTPTVLTQDSSSVTLRAQKGCEYSVNGGAFTTNTLFTGLRPGVTYVFVARYAETDTHYASEQSKSKSVEVIPDHLTSDVIDIDETNRVISNIEEGTTVAYILSSFKEGKYATVSNRQGEMLGDATVLKTGDKIVINDFFGISAEYTVVVRCDANGDGNATLTDLLLLKEILSGNKEDVPREIFVSLDVNGDGRLNVLDYSILKKIISSKETAE